MNEVESGTSQDLWPQDGSVTPQGPCLLQLLVWGERDLSSVDSAWKPVRGVASAESLQEVSSLASPPELGGYGGRA